MRLRGTHLAVAALLWLSGAALTHAQDRGPPGQLNTLDDIRHALNKCWVWPSLADSSGNMDLTIMLSFRANGDLLGGRITHVARAVSDDERALYYVALETMIRSCSHLPVSKGLGAAIAGRPFIFRIVDTRRQKRA
jgi:hypothetical protein